MVRKILWVELIGFLHKVVNSGQIKLYLISKLVSVELTTGKWKHFNLPKCLGPCWSWLIVCYWLDFWLMKMLASFWLCLIQKLGMQLLKKVQSTLKEKAWSEDPLSLREFPFYLSPINLSLLSFQFPKIPIQKQLLKIIAKIKTCWNFQW